MVTGALSALLQSGFEVDSSLMNVRCALVFLFVSLDLVSKYQIIP